MRSRWLAITVFAVTCLVMKPARADGDVAAAEALFDEGRKLIEQGKYAEACPKLEASLELDRGIGTMLFLAECWDHEGRTASAWAQFREAADLAAKSGDQREKIARRRATEIEPKLSKLTIRVPSAPESIVVERDGHAVVRAVWGTALPIDPGDHVITAAAPGYAKWKSTVRVGPNAAQATIDVPPLQPVQTSSPTPEQPAPVKTTRTWQRVLGLGVAAVGIGGLTVGTAYGLSAIAKNDRADQHCPEPVGCDPDGISLGKTADDDALISTIAISAGTVLLLGGAVLFFTASRTSSPTTTSLLTWRGFAF